MSYECLKDNENKKYIIPTQEWLEPLSHFVVDSMQSSKGFLMLSKFQKKHKIIVKITRDVTKYSSIKYASKKLLNVPNFATTFCAFTCDESSLNLETKYKNANSFCKADETDKANKEKVILELMYKYKGTLMNELLNKETVEHIMKQLCFAQLMAFDKYGFLHMDIHLDNIMYGSNTLELKSLQYKFNGKMYEIKTDLEFIICDFDKCVIFDPSMPLVEHNEKHTLLANIIRTLTKSSVLFDNNDDKNLFKSIISEMQFHEHDYYHYEYKDMRSYYRGSKDISEYKIDVIDNVKSYLHKVWFRFFNKQLFSEFVV